MTGQIECGYREIRVADSQTPELDALNRELAGIQDELLALSDDAFAERFALQKRQDELRELAAAFHQDWDSQRPTEELQAELNALRGHLKGIEDQKINLAGFSAGSSQAGSGSSGLGGVSLNQGLLKAQGANAVHARIGVIKGILADRGIDPDE
ncbi:MAG: hypothetical protein V3U46_08590 [Acidimicrobiia bacterium]